MENGLLLRKIREKKWIGPHRRQERDTCEERQSCEDGRVAGEMTTKVRPGPDAPPLGGVAGGCR